MNLPTHKVMYVSCINVWTIYILIWLIHSLFLSTSIQHLLCSQCFGRYWECSTEKHRWSSSFHGVSNLSGKQTLNKWLEEVIDLMVVHPANQFLYEVTFLLKNYLWANNHGCFSLSTLIGKLKPSRFFYNYFPFSHSFTILSLQFFISIFSMECLPYTRCSSSPWG